MFEQWHASLVLVAAAAVAGVWGARRVGRLNRLIAEPRLARLERFFVLTSAGLVAHGLAAALWESGGFAVERDGWSVQDLLFWLHHALIIGGLIEAMRAFGGRRHAPAAAFAPALLFAGPLLLLIEGLGYLSLAVRSALNHARRASFGSMEVAFGFFALLAAQGVFLFNQGAGAAPLGARNVLGEVLALLGLAVLAFTPPGGKAARG